MVNTITSYRSPVRLVKHAAEETEVFSPQAISRARKRLMAEISLTGDEIVIDDVAYSRNDASSLLDNINEQIWKVHSTIYAHEGLLNFLEKEEFDNDALRKADAYLYNTAFVQAVSPYFAHSFNSVSGRLLRQEAFEELSQLLDFGGYILPEHSHEAYQKLRNYLDELNYMLRNLSWEKFIADESLLHFVFSDEWKQFVNKLPSSFTALRDELVEQFINLVLRFQHKATWYYLHQVLVQLKSIETNDFNRSEVERIDTVIYENSQVEGGKSSRRKHKGDGEASTGRIIWWSIWIILMIVRAATCNSNSNSSTNFNDLPIRFIENAQQTKETEGRNEKKLLSSLDSLSRQTTPTISTKMKTGDQPFEGLGDNPAAAQNDSLLVMNQSDHDAVFFYFKDLPGHYRAGLLPKLYSTYIKKGDSKVVYLLPGNGRVYFAFGENWGQLKSPLTLRVDAAYSGFQQHKKLEENITITHFFSNDASFAQPYLQNPILIDHGNNYYATDEYTALTKPGDPASIPMLLITQAGKWPQVLVTGRLYAFQRKGGEASSVLEPVMESGGPPLEEK